MALYRELKPALQELSRNPNAKNVHESRVLLRRWSSVWKVLKADGWRTKPEGRDLERQLKELSQTLGCLRDCDVNIEIAESLGAARKILHNWKYERELLARKAKKDLHQLDIKALMRRLRKLLKTRPAKLKAKLTPPLESAYKHLERFVARQEDFSRQLAATARQPQELHSLRLSIKAWRYLLVEFYGLTNLELVRAQQLLGKLNDLHRIAGLLSKYESDLVSETLSKLTIQQNKLLDEFEQIRGNLPFGLRPRVSTVHNQTKVDLKL